MRMTYDEAETGGSFYGLDHFTILKSSHGILFRKRRLLIIIQYQTPSTITITTITIDHPH